MNVLVQNGWKYFIHPKCYKWQCWHLLLYKPNNLHLMQGWQECVDATHRMHSLILQFANPKVTKTKHKQTSQPHFQYICYLFFFARLTPVESGDSLCCWISRCDDSFSTKAFFLNSSASSTISWIAVLRTSGDPFKFATCSIMTSSPSKQNFIAC